MNETARELLKTLREAVVPEIEDYARFRVGPKAHELWRHISEVAALGDRDALEVMDHVGWLGCQRVISADKRAAGKGLLIIKRPDGSTERRPNPIMRAIPKVAPDGEHYVQQAFWWEMSFEEVADLFAAIERAFLRQAEKRAAFARVMDAYRLHRDAPTAAAACRMAGFDPSEIEISDTDVRRAFAA